jgi:SAM-dependent methyltransferase
MKSIRQIIKKIPVVNRIARIINRALFSPQVSFPGSGKYWKRRYMLGGNSGPGSFGKLAEFKAEIINSFVKDREINSVIEYGCGDGNQLKLAEYPMYIGFDVSPVAISHCRKLFGKDRTKFFKLMPEYANECAQLTLSLDVIYHLVEDDVFAAYMKRLFDSSQKSVIIYSSDTDDQLGNLGLYIRHRKFSKWIEKERPNWTLMQHIPNRYPFSTYGNEGSVAEFFIYERA